MKKAANSGRFLVFMALLLVPIGGFAMQAYGASCWEAQHIRNVYWDDLNTGHPGAAADLKAQNEWAFRGNCGPMDMRRYGDWDRYHHWHSSEWWYSHDRNWVQQRHPDWIAAQEHHVNEPVHEPAQVQGPGHEPAQAPAHKHFQGPGHEN